MPTIRDKFHELGNWHNKISLAAIVTRELLADKAVRELSSEELQKRIDKAVKNLDKIGEFVIGADEAVTSAKPFIYEKLGGDTEIPSRNK